VWTFATGTTVGQNNARAALAARPTQTPVIVVQRHTVVRTVTRTVYRTRSVTRTVRVPVIKTVIKTVYKTRTVPAAAPTAVPTAAPTATASAPSALQVNALTMAEQYDANKIAAEAYYKNRMVQIRGIAQDVNQDILGTYYVSVKPDGYDGWTSMQCYVSGPQAVMSVVKGNDVTVRGRVDDMTLGIIGFKDCQVVS
jgi:hypothetical protein